MKMNDGSKSLCYLALPVLLLLAAGFIQPPLASAQTTHSGVDCANINVASLLKQDNLGAGRILIECGIVRGGQPSAGGTVTEPPSPPNIRVSNGSACSSSSDVCGSESMVAGSTKDKGQTIVVNYNSNYEGSNYSGTSYSTDGGSTFTEIEPAPFANGHGENFGDPIVVFNSKLGMFFAGDLATGCGGQGIGLWTSTDGITWTAGSCPSNNSSDDRESMWVDNVGSSATYGRMFISFNDFNNNGALDVVYSDDGVTWTGPVVVSNTSTFMRDVQITGSPRGAGGAQSTVFIASMDEGGGGNATRQNVMYKSTDGGATWTTVVMGSRFNPPGDAACASNSYFWQVNPIIRHMGWGEPAVGPNGVVHYVFAGAGAKNGDKGDIFYTRSTNNGNTWSTPIKLNTDVDSAFHEQWMPSLSATSGGKITASWYDRRKSTSSCVNVGDAGCNYERVGRQSTTNGASWQAAEITISTGIITQPSQNDPDVVGCYAGDYDYNSALNGPDNGGKPAAYVTWTDGRFSISGTPVQSVDFAKVPLP